MAFKDFFSVLNCNRKPSLFATDISNLRCNSSELASKQAGEIITFESFRWKLLIFCICSHIINGRKIISTQLKWRKSCHVCRYVCSVYTFTLHYLYQFERQTEKLDFEKKEKRIHSQYIYIIMMIFARKLRDDKSAFIHVALLNRRSYHIMSSKLSGCECHFLFETHLQIEVRVSSNSKQSKLEQERARQIPSFRKMRPSLNTGNSIRQLRGTSNSYFTYMHSYTVHRRLL